MSPAFRSRFYLRCIVCVCCTGMLASASAQSYPARPVRIIVPSAAGGGTDTTTRLIAPRLGEFLGQRVIVENRPGAASIIGSDIVAHSPADGYTLLTGISTITINPSMYKKLPYDTFKNFVPVSQFISSPPASNPSSRQMVIGDRTNAGMPSVFPRQCLSSAAGHFSVRRFHYPPARFHVPVFADKMFARESGVHPVGDEHRRRRSEIGRGHVSDRVAAVLIDHELLRAL